MSIVSQEFLDINGLSHYNGLIKEKIPSLIVLTQAEYNALTETQKNDPNKYYYISDSSAVNANILNDLSDVSITNPAEDEILAYDNVNHRWINKVNRGGVTSFNGRSGSIIPTAGDYDATQIDYDANQTVKDKIDSINVGVTSFNGRSGSILPVNGDYNAEQINYDNNTSVKQKIDNLVTGVSSFNGRNGSILPTAGDYNAEDITYGQSTVKDALDNIGSSVVASFNGRNGSVLPTSGDYNATQVILSSALPIGGVSKTNTEDALTALNNTKVECVTIATEEEWNQMTEAEKNDPSKLYFLPWDTSGSGGGSSAPTADQVMLSSVMEIGGRQVDNVEDALISLNDLFKIVTWADGTDKEIAAMLEAHYNGDIDIHDYWEVGDERQVSLTAMNATGVDESHVAQTVTMVLMNAGGKTLTTPIGEITECAFIVGQKNSLVEKGYMNSSNTNSGGWDSSARRTWCNGVYKNSLPATLVNIFKQHKNITANGSSTTTATSDDYFALPSEKEVFGSITYANTTAETDNKQFKYYETSANRIKKLGDSGSANGWWERSPSSGNSASFCFVGSPGNASSGSANTSYGLAPFGVI